MSHLSWLKEYAALVEQADEALKDSVEYVVEFDTNEHQCPNAKDEDVQ